MQAINRQQISESKDLKTEVVEVPEWGGSVIVTELGALESLSLYTNPEYLTPDGSGPDPVKIIPALLIKCLVDENGERILTKDDAAMIGSKSSLVIKRLSDAAKRVNGIGQTEEQVKNSEASPKG